MEKKKVLLLRILYSHLLKLSETGRGHSSGNHLAGNLYYEDVNQCDFHYILFSVEQQDFFRGLCCRNLMDA